MLLGKTVVLGVTGSIAAWQTPEIVGQLKDLWLHVHCIMTRSATEFKTADRIAEKIVEKKNRQIERVVLGQLKKDPPVVEVIFP